MRSITPINNLVLLKKITEKTTESGIIIPFDDSNEYTVVATDSHDDILGRTVILREQYHAQKIDDLLLVDYVDIVALIG